MYGKHGVYLVIGRSDVKLCGGIADAGGKIHQGDKRNEIIDEPRKNSGEIA